jgi:hypothetical protein
MDYRERVRLFEAELDLIFSKEIREFTEECIKQAPDYVFTDCPSSSTGKYHPVDEVFSGGTILHSRRVTAVAYDICRALDCENHRDEIISACILHDMAKQGLEKSGNTIRTHPQIMAKMVADVYTGKFKDKLNRESALIIYNCIFYHYGLWSSPDIKKDLKSYTFEELCVYISDYIVSKRFIHVDCKRSSNIIEI